MDTGSVIDDERFRKAIPQTLSTSGKGHRKELNDYAYSGEKENQISENGPCEGAWVSITIHDVNTDDKLADAPPAD